MPRTEETNARYKNLDDDVRGVWASGDSLRKEYREYAFYEITTPSGRKVSPPPGSSWRFNKEDVPRLISENRLWFGKNGNGVPRIKRFLSEVNNGMIPQTIWLHNVSGNTQEAKKEVIALNKENIFETPKPERLIQRILHIATNENDLVLDSFLGSGTTAAVAHKMNRRYISIEMGDHAETHCQTRLKKVVEGEQGGISKAVNWTGGGGFQFCRLSKEPLFTADGQVRPDVTFAQLAEFVWFKETGTGFTGNTDSPLLGVFNNNAVYLLYNGILGDSDPEKGNVLTPSIYKTLPPFQGRKIIYATACRGGDSWLNREQIVLKQTPYELNI